MLTYLFITLPEIECIYGMIRGKDQKTGSAPGEKQSGTDCAGGRDAEGGKTV
jgi:hypothetical protein